MADFKTNIKTEMKAGLENCAALGRDALVQGKENSYVERMHNYFMLMVEKEIEARKQWE